MTAPTLLVRIFVKNITVSKKHMRLAVVSFKTKSFTSPEYLHFFIILDLWKVLLSEEVIESNGSLKEVQFIGLGQCNTL